MHRAETVHAYRRQSNWCELEPYQQMFSPFGIDGGYYYAGATLN